MRNLFFREKRGFTLIEILVVVAIISIMVGISLAFYKNSRPGLRLSGVVRSLVSDLRYCQSSSVAEQIEYGIIFYPSEKKYEIKRFGDQISVITTIFFPAEIQSLTLSQEIIDNSNTIKYNPYGAVDIPGQIVVENNQNKSAIVDVKASGFVNLIK